MFEFIKRHWIAYLVGIGVAIALGFGASYILGAKWSTPPETRAERVAAEQNRTKANDQLGKDSSATEDSEE